MTSAGTVGSISATLVGVTSEAPDDLDAYLSSPAGTKVMLWSDAGGDDTVPPLATPVDVTFAGRRRDGAAVGVRGLSAARVRGSIAVRWRTATEARLLGFNLYRGRGGKVNARLIRAKVAGTARSAAYGVVDRRASRSGAYRLQVVRTDGSRAWAGTTALSA